MNEPLELYCPQCGDEVESLIEGYCFLCWGAQVDTIFKDEYEQECWNAMSEKQKDLEIRTAVRKLV